MSIDVGRDIDIDIDTYVYIPGHGFDLFDGTVNEHLDEQVYKLYTNWHIRPEPIRRQLNT